MQLFLSVGGCWKCIDVSLLNGNVPCIGGTDFGDENIEPALWFKVLVLESVCIDCSERVVSWSTRGHSRVAEDDINIPHCIPSKDIFTTSNSGPEVELAIDRPNDELGSLSLIEGIHSPSYLLSPDDSYSTSPLLSLNHLLSSSIGSVEGYHSLMAPHDNNPNVSTDDLQALFELAEILFSVERFNDVAQHRGMELKKWLRLLHCYLLPLITFHHEDLAAVSQAHDSHMQVLQRIDERLEELSSRNIQLKRDLSAVLSKLLPNVWHWAQEGSCSFRFLALITSDIKFREQEARAKIQSCARNIELSGHLTTLSQGMKQQLQKDRIEAENVLLEMLQLRSSLDGMCYEMNSTPIEEDSGLQQEYADLHTQLDELRRKSYALSSEKVLALSVREAIEQTISSLINGNVTSGMDFGLQGGHSTDVLQEASTFSSHTSNYLTWREEIQKLLQLQSTPLAQVHDGFCQYLRKVLLSAPSGSCPPESSDEEVADTNSLACLVRKHFEKIADHVSTHFNDHGTAFVQRTWLCYERLFFESFSDNILSWYQVEQAKKCKQLLINAIGLSTVDPGQLGLEIADESWLLLFPSRPFVSASILYQEVMNISDFWSLQEYHALKVDSADLLYLNFFSGVTSDLSSLPLAISPLDRLQLLISAFRKAMVGLSKLKLKPYQDSKEGGHLDVLDNNLVAVSCDDILPVLVLIMLQLPPWLIANIHINCCLLTDFMAPFLTPGWHGYSLTTFSSSLHIINKL